MKYCITFSIISFFAFLLSSCNPISKGNEEETALSSPFVTDTIRVAGNLNAAHSSDTSYRVVISGTVETTEQELPIDITFSPIGDRFWKYTINLNDPENGLSICYNRYGGFCFSVDGSPMIKELPSLWIKYEDSYYPLVLDFGETSTFTGITHFVAPTTAQFE